MQERRTATRRKTFLGGRLAFNRRHSSMDCLLRNMTDRGAMLVLDGQAVVPDEFDLQVDHRASTLRARVVWRRRDQIGVVFLPQGAAGNVVPLGQAIRVRQLEAEKTALQHRAVPLGTGGE